MEDYRICILGACRDAERFLPQVLSNLDTISSWFKDCRIVIYENDSVDRTNELLMEWATQTKDNVVRHVIKESNLNSRFHYRTPRLAYIRNTLLYHIPPDFDYFMMVDLDDVFAHPVEKKSFDSCFEIKDAWDIVTANGYEGYYDIWSLRLPGVIDFDCWFRYWALMATGKYTDEEAQQEAIYKYTGYMNAIKWPVYVDGAFNVGMISKVSIIKPCCKYAGFYEGRICVEHFPFQKCLRSHGVRILYNPNFRL